MERSPTWCLSFCLTLLFPLLLASSVQAQPGGSVTAQQVRDAIDGGVKYLLQEQHSKRGTWSQHGRYEGGVTALCTLALLNAGVPTEHPQIQRALRNLRTIEPKTTYVVALQTMVFCTAEPRKDLGLIQRNVKWLESVQLQGGQWSYPQGGGDNSNSQFAVLALHEAERAGAKVQQQTWEKAAAYWKGCQNVRGSWGYLQAWEHGTGSMTCAGIAATVICNGHVNEPNAIIKNGLVQCCQAREDDDALERALRWLGNNFSVRRNPGLRQTEGTWRYYYLYGLERVGRLTARRFIGEYDWYREGAEFLVKEQDPFSRSWTGTHHAEDNPHVATPLALLFLAKGRRPILMSKLEHGPADDWNNHRSDVANLTMQAEELWDLDLTWQVMDPQTASVDDLLQSPVLYVSGSRTPDLIGTETKMRDYIDRGGFLFVESCCFDSSPFRTGFKKYLDKVFPEQEYKLRRAGPEHPIWRVERLVRPESPYVGRIWTVEYGCRTCVVFSELDLSCYWELVSKARRKDLPKVVSQRIIDANSIGLNVLAYATNREPKGKEASFVDNTDLVDLEALGSRGTIQIAKLQHGGGCNDAPGALVNLLRTAAQGELQLRISTKEFAIRADDKSLPRFHMAFMHGRHDFRFTDGERNALKEYVSHGGTLFADSICASKKFADAFRREMRLLFPEDSLRRIPADDVMFTEAAGGHSIPRVQRRDPVEQQANQPLRTRVREVEPELEGINIDGRWAVIFSPYDISCALEKHEAQECRGYTQEDAARIGLNVLMYTLNPDVEVGL